MQKKQKNFIAHSDESKLCPVCGRVFYNRKKWKLRGIWDTVIYCSDKCRKGKKAGVSY